MCRGWMQLQLFHDAARTLKGRDMGQDGTVLGFSFYWEIYFGTNDSCLVSKLSQSWRRCLEGDRVVGAPHMGICGSTWLCKACEDNHGIHCRGRWCMQKTVNWKQTCLWNLICWACFSSFCVWPWFEMRTWEVGRRGETALHDPFLSLHICWSKSSCLSSQHVLNL